MEQRRIHWTELFGNRYRFALNPLMLTSSGYEVKIATKIKGESKTQLFPVIVTFDEEYAIQYLTKILEALNPPRLADWIKIANKAYACYEKENK